FYRIIEIVPRLIRLIWVLIIKPESLVFRLKNKDNGYSILGPYTFLIISSFIGNYVRSFNIPITKITLLTLMNLSIKEIIISSIPLVINIYILAVILSSISLKDNIKNRQLRMQMYIYFFSLGLFNYLFIALVFNVVFQKGSFESGWAMIGFVEDYIIPLCIVLCMIVPGISLWRCIKKYFNIKLSKIKYIMLSVICVCIVFLSQSVMVASYIQPVNVNVWEKLGIIFPPEQPEVELMGSLLSFSASPEGNVTAVIILRNIGTVDCILDKISSDIVDNKNRRLKNGNMHLSEWEDPSKHILKIAPKECKWVILKGKAPSLKNNKLIYIRWVDVEGAAVIEKVIVQYQASIYLSDIK
ncbi:MAG: hypothetical protein KOO63_10175, partial [Bacteroidales bacterium]|nr:hypothetical protein [Candidatus Latescibacterota bacterium]